MPTETKPRTAADLQIAYDRLASESANFDKQTADLLAAREGEDPKARAAFVIDRKAQFEQLRTRKRVVFQELTRLKEAEEKTARQAAAAEAAALAARTIKENADRVAHREAAARAEETAERARMEAAGQAAAAEADRLIAEELAKGA